MDFIRGILSSSSLSSHKGDSSFFLENGSLVLKEFLTLCNGRTNIPIRNFSAKEVAKAVNNFDCNDLLCEESYFQIYRGYFEKRPVLVKKFRYPTWKEHKQMCKQLFARDMVISSQMSVHKNVLKVIGCCLDFVGPAIVYQCPEVSHLNHRMFYTEKLRLTWKNRLSVASDIANVVAYLHSAFPTPIIHRNLKLSNVVIDRYGSAKISDFLLSISLPPGESQVEDIVFGTISYVDPKYAGTGILSEKSDVYSMGVILVELLTGKKCNQIKNCSDSGFLLRSYVEGNQVKDIVNGNIVIEGETGQDEQFQAFAALAMRCLAEEWDDRPKMVDVAKELRKIQGLGCTSMSM